MDFPLPEWLSPSSASPNQSSNHSVPPKAYASLTPEERALERQTFGIAFEHLLESMANATTFSHFCLTYLDPFGRPLSTSRFRTWIFHDQSRRRAYYTAKALAAEAIEDDLIRIADGFNPDGSLSLADPARSKLQVDVRFKLLPIFNPKRYAPTTRVETNTTVTTKNLDALPTLELKRLLLQKNPTLAKKYGITMDGMDPGEAPIDPIDPIDFEDDPDSDPDSDNPVPLDPIDG